MKKLISNLLLIGTLAGLSATLAFADRVPNFSGVTSITAGNGLMGGTITGAGTISLSSPVISSNGGTGTTTWKTGSIPFFGGSNFTEDNANLFWDNTNKRLGIGTNNPIVQFTNSASGVTDQSGTGGSITGILWSTANTGYSAVFSNSNSSTNAQGLFAKIMGTSSSNRVLTLNANGTDVMVVQGGGSVGIGTTTPIEKLQIGGGNIVIDNTMAYKIKDNAGISQSIVSQTSGNNVQFTNFSTTGSIQYGVVNNSGRHQFLIGSASYDAMDIAQGGYIGISTSTPGALLTIASSTGASTLSLLSAGAGTGVPAFTVLGSGNVGIGTSSPSNALTITSGAILVSEIVPATSTAMTIDWRTTNSQDIKIGTATTTITFSNYLAGQSLTLMVCNPPTGTAGALVFSTTTPVYWSGGTTPTQTTSANHCDSWSFKATNATGTTPVIFGTQAANF